MISFDQFVSNPRNEIIKISKFLKKKPTKKTFQQFRKERIPRELFDKNYYNKVNFLKKKLSKNNFLKLLKYENEYLTQFGYEKKIY